MAVYDKTIIITGGAGFIGSNLLLYLIPRYPNYRFINIDCLTYAGNLANLREIEGKPNYGFEKIDIRDYERLRDCFERNKPDGLINLAAESHVDRSIIGPAQFIETNIIGTFNLLELARAESAKGRPFRFHQISTDEVYGAQEGMNSANEESPYRPSSPYSASKGSADLLVRAYNRTYRLDTVITISSNNFGPYQFPEKLVPLTIRNVLAGISIPIYGDGLQIRDWLYVKDHCRAIDLVFHKGVSGKSYNIGGGRQAANIDIVRSVCNHVDRLTGGGPSERLIELVQDRPGHDRRYAIDTNLIRSELGWRCEHPFEQALDETVEWYLNNQRWLADCISGEYANYYEKIYVKGWKS